METDVDELRRKREKIKQDKKYGKKEKCKEVMDVEKMADKEEPAYS
jgi:hypothetical protein